MMAKDINTILLETAEQATPTRGFDRFSYADLATAAAITKASIHHHFASKASLTLALMQR